MMEAPMPEHDHLEETEFMDFSNPRVVETAKRLTSHLHKDRDKALSVFKYVRDEIKYGWTSNFHKMRASEVLEARVGYSLTKATLFCALLRCVEIPARQVFVDISSKVFDGLSIEQGPYLDHCFSEVFIDGRWIKVDSYIVDYLLHYHARRRLCEEKLTTGFGIHVNGSIEWDGECDAFVQYVFDGTIGDISRNEWGVFADVGDFYARASGTHNNYDVIFPITTWVLYLAMMVPNSRVSALRRGVSQ